MAVSLKAARVNKGLILEEASKEIGVTKNTLCSWENGKTFPNAPQIKKIMEVYGMSYEDIIFSPEDNALSVED